MHGGTPRALHPLSLLYSQFDTLEEPTPEEQLLVISIDRRPDEIVAEIAAALMVP